MMAVPQTRLAVAALQESTAAATHTRHPHCVSRRIARPEIAFHMAATSKTPQASRAASRGGASTWRQRSPWTQALACSRTASRTPDSSQAPPPPGKTFCTGRPEPTARVAWRGKLTSRRATPFEDRHRVAYGPTSGWRCWACAGGGQSTPSISKVQLAPSGASRLCPSCPTKIHKLMALPPIGAAPHRTAWPRCCKHCNRQCQLSGIWRRSPSCAWPWRGAAAPPGVPRWLARTFRPQQARAPAPTRSRAPYRSRSWCVGAQPDARSFRTAPARCLDVLPSSRSPEGALQSP
mmetsp:Transcript_14931/g.40965  ORF Transcript_14931/g.40965 Transcript_14931/m.40965 type:complete len:292 (-) Transcript_14931:1374-2249(-)